MNADDLLYRLLSIGTIKKGETLSTTTFLPVEKAYWSTTFSRTYNRENRKETVKSIKEVVDQALDFINLNPNHPSTAQINDALVDCIKGLENLKETYKGDFDILGAISTIINNIKTPVFTEVFVDMSSDWFDAIKSKNYTFVENYIYEGKDINVKNLNNQNALHFACEKQYYDKKILELLVSFDIDLTLKNIYGNDPLFVAVTSGSVESVLILEDAIKKRKSLV